MALFEEEPWSSASYSATSDPTGNSDQSMVSDPGFTHTTAFNVDKRYDPFQSVMQILGVFGLLAFQGFRNTTEDAT